MRLSLLHCLSLFWDTLAHCCDVQLMLLRALFVYFVKLNSTDNFIKGGIWGCLITSIKHQILETKLTHHSYVPLL